MSPLRLVGAALIFLCAMATVREYSAFCKRRIAEGEAFASLLRHLKERVCVYLLPVSSAVADFDDTELSRVGFIGALRSCGSLHSAFALVRDKLLISDGQKELLSSFFADFGGAYVKDERERIERAEDTLLKLQAEDEKKTGESEKVAKTLILASALGLIILIL